MILTEEARELNQMYEDLKADCKRLNIKQKHIAYELGTSQENVSYLLTKKKLSLEQFVYIRCLLRRAEGKNNVSS